MKIKSLWLLTFWASIGVLTWAQDLNLLNKSNHPANEEIVLLLQAGKLNSNLEIINQVGQRADLDFNLVISYLANHSGLSKGLNEEVLLEKLLSLIFAPSRSEESKQQAALLNAPSLDKLYRNFHILTNSYLQSQLLETLGYQSESPHLNLIAEEAKRLVSLSKKGQLALAPSEERKAWIILQAIARLKRKEFIFICAEFNKWLSNPALARQARKVAQSLTRP